ncbi:MAG: PEP-CTERM system TPR-repeat protein PrsT [Burkholderiaceae bacterium]
MNQPRPHLAPSATRIALRVALAASLLGAGVLLSACSDSPEALMSKARASIQKDDRKAAEIHLKNLLQARENDAEARVMLADLHAGAYDWNAAEKEYRRALEAGANVNQVGPKLLSVLSESRPPTDYLKEAQQIKLTEPAAQAQAGAFAALAAQRLGRQDEARREYQRALELDPGLTTAKIGLLQLSTGKETPQRLAEQADALVAGDPKSREALLYQAQVRSTLGNIDGARQSLTKAIELNPRDIQARSELAALEFNARNDQATAEQLDAIDKIVRGWPVALSQRAALQLRQGKNEAARDSATLALKFSPNYLPALVNAASANLALDSLEQAETLSRQIIENAPGAPAGAQLLAATLLKKGEPERALAVVKPLIDRGNTDPNLLAIAGEAALHARDPKSAAGYFDRSVSERPEVTGPRVGLALARLDLGDHKGGLSELETASNADPGSTQADIPLIETLLRDRQWDKALAAIDRLEKKTPKSARAAQLRGIALMGKNDQAGARAAFEKAIALEPKFLTSYGNLAALDIAQGYPQQARVPLQKLVDSDPANSAAMIALAEVMKHSGASHAEVTAVLEKAYRADPDSVRPTIALALDHMQNDKAADAVPLLQRALPLNPRRPELLETLVIAFLRSGQQQQAVDTMDRLAREYPQNFAVQSRVGQFKLQMKNPSGAVENFQAATRIDSRSVPARAMLASALAASGKPDGALQEAKRLQKDLPDQAAGWQIEGDLLLQAGKLRESLVPYRRAVQTSKPPTATVMRVHQVLIQAGETAEADRLLKDRLKASPNDLTLQMYAGDRELARNDFRAAANHYEAAVKLDGGNAAALNNLAWTLYRLKDDKALAYAEQAYRLAPKLAPVLDTYGVILNERREYGRAVPILKQAVELAPKAPDIRLHYAQALAGIGDSATARTESDAILRDFPDSPDASAARELQGNLK